MHEDNLESTVVPPATDTGNPVDPSQRIERTEAEKAAYNLKKNAERARELGVDPRKVFGETNDDEVPAWYKAEKAKEIQKTSLQLADSISDEDTREKVKDYLQNRLVPSGNAEEDFRLALGAASASKNKQVLEEMNRYSTPRRTAAGSSQPANIEEPFVPTESEATFMKPPYNLSKEKILENRKKSQSE